MIPGALVLVTTGRYWLHHARVESVLPDRGAHGFARLRFFGRSGYPLKRTGMRWDGDLPLPPEDLVPMTELSVIERGGPVEASTC